MGAGVLDQLGLLGMQPVQQQQNPMLAQSLGLETPQQQHMNLARLLLQNAPRFQHVPIQPGVQGLMPMVPQGMQGIPTNMSQQGAANYMQILRALAARNPLMSSGEQAGSPLTMMMLQQGLEPPEPVPT